MSVAGYVSWLRDSGLYVDGVLSYGQFSGDKFTSQRYAKTGELKGTSLAASVEMGVPFYFGDKSWMIEPQTQIIYQKLDFDTFRDIDRFTVESTPTQVLARICGRVQKQFDFAKFTKFALNGTLNYTQTVQGDGNVVTMGDDFKTGSFSNNVEIGAGLDVGLKMGTSLYGAFTYNNLSAARA